VMFHNLTAHSAVQLTISPSMAKAIKLSPYAQKLGVAKSRKITLINELDPLLMAISGIEMQLVPSVEATDLVSHWFCILILSQQSNYTFQRILCTRVSNGVIKP